jgi:hypothetical protein
MSHTVGRVTIGALLLSSWCVCLVLSSRIKELMGEKNQKKKKKKKILMSCFTKVVFPVPSAPIHRKSQVAIPK